MSHSTHEMGQAEGALGRAAHLVSAARADFDRLSINLDHQVQGLRGQWAGSGGRAFFALHRAWTEQMDLVVGSLDRFAVSLVATEQDNVATDEAESTRYRHTLGRLGR